MLESIFTGILSVIGLVAFIFIWSEITSRIPPKFEEKIAPLGAPDFAAWVKLEGFIVDEFRVGYVGGWTIGHELKTNCIGTVKLGSGPIKLLA